MTSEGGTATDVVVPTDDFAATLEFFTERLGFRLDAIFPADAPSVAMLSGFGVHLRLDGRDDSTIDLPLAVPEGTQSLVVSRAGDAAAWSVGRAGMRYRDLIPGRQGGRFIASHIHIPQGGPVPDYVHFHKVRFQLIYCRRGWARLVYEDQGEPFLLQQGDCVLQPPTIRHRVLESSDDLEVVEVSCPAEHVTAVDHDMELPTDEVVPDKDFLGQRFVRHVAADAQWHHGPEGFEARNTGIVDATDGLAGAVVWRPVSASRAPGYRCEHEFWFGFVLQGSLTVTVDGVEHQLGPAEHAMTIPSGCVVRLGEASTDLEVLSVSLPANPKITRVEATQP